MAEKYRGLKAVEGARRTDMFMIDPRSINVKEGFNARMNYGDIEKLAAQIKEWGVKVPLKVFMEDGKVFVSAGHRRLAAINLLLSRGEDFSKGVPCMSEGNNFTVEKGLFDQVLTNDGEKLDMLEQGILFDRLVGRGYNQNEIATKIGMTASHVSNCMTLAKASKRIQNLIVEGKVKATTVLDTIRALPDDEEAQFKALTDAIAAAAENGKESAKPETVRRAVSRSGGVVRETPAKRVKLMGEWLEENSVVLADNPVFESIKLANEYLIGKLTIEELTVKVGK